MEVNFGECFPTKDLQEATKLNFIHSSCVVITLLSTDLCKSAFSTYSFNKLVFRLSECSEFFCLFCFELNVIFLGFIYDVCVIIIYIGTTCSVILLSPRNF